MHNRALAFREFAHPVKKEGEKKETGFSPKVILLRVGRGLGCFGTVLRAKTAEVAYRSCANKILPRRYCILFRLVKVVRAQLLETRHQPKHCSLSTRNSRPAPIHDPLCFLATENEAGETVPRLLRRGYVYLSTLILVREQTFERTNSLAL